MIRGLTGRMVLAGAVPAVVITVVLAVLLLAIGNLRRSADYAQDSQQVIVSSSSLEQLVLDLETGVRGYIITHDQRFLEPWQSALRTYPARARALVQAVQDDPGQKARAEALVRAIDSYRDEYSKPLVVAAEQNLPRAASTVATGEGKRRIDAIRNQFSTFVAAEQSNAAKRQKKADANGRLANSLAGAGFAATVMLLIAYAVYLARAIALPIRRVAAGAHALAGGDLSTRVDEGGTAEAGELAQAFNTMAVTLAESRDELESQNTELEIQAAELEEHQAQLAEANVELEMQHAELERALEDVAAEKERVDALYRFGDAIIREAELEPRGGLILQMLADSVEADLGALYVVDERHGNAQRLVAARGLNSAQLPSELRPGEGLAGRALAEGRAVVASHGDAALRFSTFGGEVAVRHEVHIPLIQGESQLGVLTLARAQDRAFAPAELDLVEHLAVQATVALANAILLRRARREAGISHAVLDATRDGIRLIDQDGHLVLQNAAMDRITSSIAGLPQRENFFENTGNVSSLMTDPDSYRQMVTAIAADPNYDGSYEFVLAESGRSFAVHTAPVSDGEGALLGRVLAVREDTSERQADRLKSDLVATVSHELRTPLASVLGFAELLVSRELDKETQRQYLETIHGEARRLTDLVNDFLDLQRIETGSFTLDLKVFELADLLGDQAKLFVAVSTQHRIDVEVPNQPLEVLGERARIGQVVGNLISNAIKYSPAGGTVTVSAAQTRDCARVEVRDEGIGIPTEQRFGIFSKFFRVDSSDTREIGGTGLGLALCREIIQAHGGRIGFDTVEGRGSTFWFELPAKE